MSDVSDQSTLDFSHGAQARAAGTGDAGAQRPLAYRMRPRTLEEFAGQSKVLSPGKPLMRWIQTDRVPSLILWGPPGSGKTTLAQLIAGQTQSAFHALSAITSGVKDLREKCEAAAQLLRFQGKKTILFVDEIHRFNKGQQDALLPFVEDGSIALIGATTENPSFELNRALLSRTRVIRFEPLAAADVAMLLQRALTDVERGLGGTVVMTDEARQLLAEIAEGDARRALTLLESVVLAASEAAKRLIDPEVLRELLASGAASSLRETLAYDADGEEHHNTVSAFIKSMRASDPDAAIYYLARMIQSGEDVLFIARRMVIFASEDVGNADPRALQVAVAAFQAADQIGLPEARIVLAQAVTYLSVAPKSRASYEAIGKAFEEIERTGAPPIPMHLRNPVTALMKSLGYGREAAPGSEGAALGNLPEAVKTVQFYEPWDSGLERTIREKLRLNYRERE